MELRVIRTKKYEKNFQKYYKANLVDLNKLNSIINTIAKGERLAEKYRDHKLHGELKDLRECHVAPDILLIYKIEKDILVLILMNIGSHSELFR
jgi:mRNA interferase YafQ